MPHPIPHNEEQRLIELEHYQILDTMPEREYDDIAALAARVCGTQMSTVALLDSDRKWHKAKFGVAAESVPREISICAHTVMGTAPLIVDDTLEHEVFRSVGMVTNPPHVRFCAGVPLINPGGYALGTICVIDKQPHHLNDTQRSSLSALARNVVTLLELRRASLALDLALAQKQAALDDVELLSGLLPICCECKSIRDDKDYWHKLESWFSQHSEVSFSHGYCPECQDKALQELATTH